MTNLAGETIDARCVGCVHLYIYIYILSIVGFRGVRSDPDETPNDRKLTGLDDFESSDQEIDLMAARLADGPTGLTS
jgi:hypothetical protein